MVAVAFGGDVFNRIDHIKTVRYFAEYGITPTVQAGRGVVEEVVVFGVDKELGGCGMRGLGTRHGDGVFVVFQAVLRFVLNAVAGGFFAHIRGHAAALYHESFDDAVENHAVVKAVFNVLFEVGGSNRGFFVIQFEGNHAFVGGQFNHFAILSVEVKAV